MLRIAGALRLVESRLARSSCRNPFTRYHLETLQFVAKIFENPANSCHVRAKSMQVICPHCNATLEIAAEHAGESMFCPECGGKSQAPIPAAQPAGDADSARQQAYQDFVSKKVAVGVLGVVLGWAGIHKFVLGFSTAGAIMLVTSLCLGLGLCCIFGPIGFFPMWIVGFIEGVIYLSKTDDEFYRDYGVDGKQWF